jgi:phage I-like protein
MTATGTAKPLLTHSRGSVAHGVRAARSVFPPLREGHEYSSLGAYALPQLGRAFALRSLVGLTGEQPESRMCWIHCAYEGTWEGHSEGAFTLNNALFKSCIATFEEQRNPLPVDYEHASVRSDVLKAPAAGWVQSLELRGDGLWALVEWTKEAADEIRSGAYRYCSGVFVFDKPDRKSGEPIACSLHSIALTNTPFIDGQKPIVLSQRRVALSAGGHMEIDRGALEEALKKLEGDSFTPDQLKALIESVEAMSRAQDPEAEAEDVDVSELEELAPEESAEMSDAEDAEKAALSDEPEAEEAALADVPADPAAVMAELESIAAAMGKDVGGLLAYLREMAAAGAGDAAAANPAALKAEVAALKATMQSYGKQLAKYRERDEAEAKAKRAAEQRALSAEVDGMVETGVIVKADADAWRSLALADAKRFRALKSTLKPAVPTGREASAIAAPAPESASVDGPPLDKSDPKVRALYDRFKTVWRETDPVKLDRLVRNAIQSQSSAG